MSFLTGIEAVELCGCLHRFPIHEHQQQHAKETHRIKQRHSSVRTGPTSIGVLSLQTLSVQYMDLSDQLRVATHPRPTCLRRLFQSQLSGRQRVDVTVRELMKPTGVKYFTLIYSTLVFPASVSKQYTREPN